MDHDNKYAPFLKWAKDNNYEVMFRNDIIKEVVLYDRVNDFYVSININFYIKNPLSNIIAIVEQLLKHQHNM